MTDIAPDAAASFDPASAETSTMLLGRTPAPEPSDDLPPEPPHDPVVDFAIFNIETGSVRVTGHMPYSMLPLQARAYDEGIVLEWLDNTTHYVDVAAIPPAGKARPTLLGFDKLEILADDTDAATINLPIASRVTLDGHDHDCPAGPLAFKADSPGVYEFTINQFPYRDFGAKVVAK